MCQSETERTAHCVRTAAMSTIRRDGSRAASPPSPSPSESRIRIPSHEITEIAIINVSSAEGDNLTETEIQRIEDTDTFLEEFRKIGCHTYFGDPISVLPEGEKSTVIKISYQNGSYGLINWNGQTEYTPEKGLKYYAGYSVFDEDQFKSLISKYAPYSFTQS